MALFFHLYKTKLCVRGAWMLAGLMLYKSCSLTKALQGASVLDFWWNSNYRSTVRQILIKFLTNSCRPIK